MKEIAVLCFENPFNKPVDGAKNDMKTRILSLVRSGKYIIDVYVFNKPHEERAEIDEGKYGIRNFYQYSVQSYGIRGFFSGLPISVFKRYTKECIDEIKKHIYDAVIYEGEHMSSYRIKGIIQAKLHVLRQHDIESNYRRELSKSAPGLTYKYAQIFECWKYKKLEKDIDRYFDFVLFISKEEKKEFEKKYIGTKCKFIFMPPASSQISSGFAKGSKKKEILYFGNMELQNNVLSILWFVREVFPIIVMYDNEAKLKIIGKVSEENKKKILENSRNIEILGYVDDLSEEINQAALIASPVLYGAGVKVKVIDALSYGQVVCATTKAIEGTELIPGKHLIVQDDPEKLALECVKVLNNRSIFEDMAFAGWEFIKKYHSIEHQAEILAEIL